jgi:hypothetical protein
MSNEGTIALINFLQKQIDESLLYDTIEEALRNRHGS